MKKTQGKSKTTAKDPAKKRTTTRTKKPADMVQVRENINDLVRISAKDIATGVIKVAKTGQLASAKYLFEAVGLYPATEATAAKPEEDWMQNTLMKQLVEPADPEAMSEEDAEEAPDGTAGTTVESANPNPAVGKRSVKSEPGESVN
ncbi:MAG: hypothetical protein WB562_15735 [Candidatus Sulfotelmatobacter sp.]